MIYSTLQAMFYIIGAGTLYYVVKHWNDDEPKAEHIYGNEKAHVGKREHIR